MAKPKVPSRLEYLENLYGIDETVDVLEFLAKIAKAVKLSLADDDAITVSDALNFIEPLTAVAGAVTGIASVPLELQDEITEEEKAKLMAVVVSAGVVPERALQATDEALDIAESLKRFILEYFIKE